MSELQQRAGSVRRSRGRALSGRAVISTFAVAALMLLFPAGRLAAAPQARPNVVLIVTDNHGAWTLGCYGNREIRTPQIDRLAREGTLFENAFACNPVCSPTRATLLTGLMPSQHGVHCFLFGGRLQIGPEARNTLEEFTSLPEIFRAAGYACGLVGKWHLGDNLNPQEGFDDCWVTMPHGGTSTFYGAEIIEDGRIRREPRYLTDFWTDRAVRFISDMAARNREGQQDRPFFLMLSYNGPYALGRLLLEDGRNRHAAYYARQTLSSFPAEPVHPWQFSNRDYIGNPTSIRRVATEVSGVDDGVGRVLATLRDLGLDDSTLVVFVADQGWVGGHGGFFGMGDHTRPVTARDGMMHIPLIFRWPGKIPAGRRSRALVANYDVMPTILSQAGLADRMPARPASPGHDLSAEIDSLRGDVHDAVFYEFESLRCVRTREWKYVHRHPNGPHELYWLTEDPDEFENLAGRPEYSKQRALLKKKLKDWFADYSQPQYDLWRGGNSQTRTFVGIEEPLAQEAPAEPPSPVDGFTPATLNVPDGYTVELAAAPPLVTHPTMACFDDRGRLFVCENAGVNLSAAELEEQLPNSIRMLEDTDRDGRFDRSTVFADRMTFPMGGAWHEGALYVAAPPSIWRLEDTTGDGVADRREILVSEFGYTGNAASIHGCFNGPDGRLYWCDGRHGHEFRDDSGNVTSRLEGSYLFSCRPDGSDIRIHAGGGPDNPVEIDFTEQGEMLGTVNIMYSRPRVDCLVHWQYGGVYPHYERVLRERPRTGSLLGPVHRFGHVAVSGMMRYRSGALDHRFQDSIFATFFNGGRVVRLEPERRGSTFEIVQREFLSADSRDFHPTDVLEDADGSLLVVDTGGWFYRGCPTSQMARPDVLGAIYRVRRRGMTPLVDPWGLRLNWHEMPATELARRLNDTRFKVRERSVRECVRRGEVMIPVLERTIQRGDVRSRINALWALTAMRGNGVQAARRGIRSALQDRSVRVRHVAVRSLSTSPDPQALDLLVDRLQQDTAPVRREAAHALGRTGDPAAVPALLAALQRFEDREEEHALIYALIELDAPEATAAGLSSESPSVRRGALIALDQMATRTLAPETVITHLDSADTQLQQAALEIVLSHPAWLPELAAALMTGLSDSDTERAERFEPVLLASASAAAGHEAIATAIGTLLESGSLPADTRSKLLRAISRGQPIECHATWENVLSRMLASADAAEISLALDVLQTARSRRLTPQLQKIVDRESLPALLRVSAITALSGSGTLNPAAFDLLLGLAADEAHPAESARAAQLLGASSLSSDQLVSLAPLLTTAGPVELRDLIRPFGRNRSVPVAEAFLESLEPARSLLSLPMHEVSDIVKRYPRELLPRANALLDRLKRADAERIARVDELLPLLKTGVAERGRDIFFSEKARCGVCHRVGDRGGRIGPDLTTIGDNRSVRDLLESIVFPSASIVRQYESYTVTTVTGRSYSGLILRETEDSLQIQQATGDPVSVRRDEIDTLTPGTVSVMPQGLDKALTRQQLADVIAWLKGRRQTSPDSHRTDTD